MRPKAQAIKIGPAITSYYRRPDPYQTLGMIEKNSEHNSGNGLLDPSALTGSIALVMARK